MFRTARHSLWHRVSRKRAFTLIEVLLSVGIIAVIAGVTIQAIAPRKNILSAADSARIQHARQIERGLYQYLIKTGEYPNESAIGEGSANRKPICSEGTANATDGCISLDSLVEDYLAAIPWDAVEPCPTLSGFKVYKDAGRPMVVPTHLGKLAGDTGIEEGCDGAPAAGPVSVTSIEQLTWGNGASYRPVITPDGSMVAFASNATDLAPGDTNGFRDAFVYTRATNTFRIVSRNGTTLGNGTSDYPAISDDGRYVGFSSDATNLVSPANGFRSVFRHDRDSDVDSIFDEDAANTAEGSNVVDADPTNFANTVSAPFSWMDMTSDGRYVTFSSLGNNLVAGDGNGAYDIFVHDHQTDATVRVSVASDRTESNGPSYTPAISADGRYVVFYSSASNLVAGDTNARTDVFLHDRDTDADGIFDEAGAESTIRVSVSSQGDEADGNSSYPAISANGRYVVFMSTATNLVPNDTNAVTDIFLYDVQTAAVERVNVTSAGEQAIGGASTVGGFAVTDDGRFVVYSSTAANLVDADTNGVRDVFLRDRTEGTTLRLTEVDGVEGTGSAYGPFITPDGGYVAFYSYDTNLVPGDTNGWTDIFFVTLSGG